MPRFARVHRVVQTAYRALWLPELAGFVWFTAVAVALLAFLSWKLPTDPDLFWHVRAGNDILAHGIPHVNWYSHTFATFPWVDHEWAVEVPMALLHRLGGFRLVTIAFALLLTGTLTLGLKWALPRKVEWPWVLVAGGTIAWLSASFLGSRPQMLTYLLLLLLLGLLRRTREQATQPNGRPGRYLWLVPVLLLAWANLHGSFILGLAVLGTWVAAEVALRILPGLQAGSPLPYRTLWQLIGVSALAVAVTFANPYLHGVWVEALRTLHDGDLHKNIVEWFSPEVRSEHGLLLFGTTLLLVVSLALRRTRLELPQLAVTLLLWVAALSAVRNLPLFYLVAVPQVLLVARELLPQTLRLLRLWPVLVALTLLMLVAVARTTPVHDLWNVGRSDQAYLDARYPVGAARYLAAHPELVTHAHPYNNYAWGGYLLLYVPGLHTFIDGRMPSWEQGGVRIIDEYFKLDRLEPGWEDALKRYDVDLVIVAPDHKLALALAHNHGFHEAFKDSQAVVLVRDDDR